MKKILFGLIILFIGSQFSTSCSSERNVLSQFSKRKYMKRFKKKDIKYKDEIKERDNNYTAVEKVENRSYASLDIEETNPSLAKMEIVNNSIEVELPEEKLIEISSLKENYSSYSNIKSYKPFVDFSSLDVNTISKLDSGKSSDIGMSDTTLILGILLWVIYPLYPLSLFLSDSDKFLLTFALYAIGLILVISGAGADNIAIAVAGGVIFFIGWIYALIMLAKNA